MRLRPLGSEPVLSTKFQVEGVPQNGAEDGRKLGPSAPAAAPTSRRWRSTDLFGPAHEVEIEHGQAVYRLRLTSLGKLILTK